MLQRILAIIVVSSFLSSNANAGVHVRDWRNDRVFVKALYVVAAVMTVGGMAGFGALIGSSLSPPTDMSCCEREKSCSSRAPLAQVNATKPSPNVCHLPLDCAKYSAQYKEGCSAETSEQNQGTIVGLAVGAGSGVLIYTAFCFIKICQHYAQTETQPLIRKESII